MTKKIMGLFFALFILVIFIPNGTALAAPKLNVTVSAGIDGKAKYDKGGPISVTVENTGTPFSGDLVIDVMESYGQGMGRAIPLHIGTGETKTVSYFVSNMEGASGMYGSPNSKSIYFYENGWEKGKEIAHTGAQNISATMYYDEKIIVTFTNNVDRLVSLKSVDFDHIPNAQLVDSAKIGPTNLPDEAIGWDAVDYIVIDEYAIADLGSEKQDALLEWVNKGGVMIFGSSNNIEGEAGVFSSYLPLKLKGQIEIDPSLLNSWAKTEEFTDRINAFSAEIAEDAVSLVKQDEDILVAAKKVGQGIVVQTAFSLGDEPLSKSADMPLLWKALFANAENTNSSSNQNMYNPLNHLSYTLGDTNELFPSFKVSAPLIFGIIILYLIIIIPVLYFILKRKDKREYAWWIIPTIALLTSVAIFGYGSKGRIGRAQIQHTAVLHVENDESLRGYYAESILANKSRDYTFTAPSETTLTASLQGSVFDGGGSKIHKRAMHVKDVTGTQLHFRDLGFWNVATIYGESHVNPLGEISMDLQIKDKVLSGSILNEFPFELRDVSIWSGSDLIPLQNLGPGETIEVNEELKLSMLLSKFPLRQYGMHQNFLNKDNLMEIRKDSLLSFASDTMGGDRKPVLIGFTDTKLIPVSLEKVKTSVSALTMIMQPFEVNNIFEGELILDTNMMEVFVTTEENGYGSYTVDYPTEEMYHEGFEYTLTWKLPSDLTDLAAAWKKLTISNIRNHMYTTQLFNIETEMYEQIDAKELEIIENINEYMTDDGRINIRIDFANGQYGNFDALPKIELIGEVAK